MERAEVKPFTARRKQNLCELAGENSANSVEQCRIIADVYLGFETPCRRAENNFNVRKYLCFAPNVQFNSGTDIPRLSAGDAPSLRSR